MDLWLLRLSWATNAGILESHFSSHMLGSFDSATRAPLLGPTATFSWLVSSGTIRACRIYQYMPVPSDRRGLHSPVHVDLLCRMVPLGVIFFDAEIPTWYICCHQWLQPMSAMGIFLPILAESPTKFVKSVSCTRWSWCWLSSCSVFCFQSPFLMGHNGPKLLTEPYVPSRIHRSGLV